MKFLLFITLLFALNITNSFGQMTKICDIQVNEALFAKLDKYSIQFYEKGNKFIKESQGVFFEQLIEKSIIKLDSVNPNSLLFIAYSTDSSKITFSFSDVSHKISKIPVILAGKDKITLPDTLRLFDVGSNLNKDELAQVDDVFTYMQKYKIVFQFPLNKAQITDINKKVFLNFFLVFPQDNSSDRWLGNIYKIEVYKI
jgi:hypothetical protein